MFFFAEKLFKFEGQCGLKWKGADTENQVMWTVKEGDVDNPLSGIPESKSISDFKIFRVLD